MEAQPLQRATLWARALSCSISLRQASSSSGIGQQVRKIWHDPTQQHHLYCKAAIHWREASMQSNWLTTLSCIPAEVAATYHVIKSMLQGRGKLHSPGSLSAHLQSAVV